MYVNQLGVAILFVISGIGVVVIPDSPSVVKGNGTDDRVRKPLSHKPTAIKLIIAIADIATAMKCLFFVGTTARRSSGSGMSGMLGLLAGTGQCIKFVLKQCVAWCSRLTGITGRARRQQFSTEGNPICVLGSLLIPK